MEYLKHGGVRLFSCIFFFCFFSIAAFGQFGKKDKQSKADTELIDQLQEAEAIFAEGMKEYVLENYSKALSAFEKSLNLKKDNPATNYMIAQIYYRQRNYYKAIQFAQTALKLDDSNKYYYLLLAQLYNQKQDFNEEAKTYQALIKKVPNTQEHYYDLASVYFQQQKYEEAIKALDKFEKYVGINEEIIKQKQQLYLKLNKINDAIAEGVKLMEAYPDEPRYVVNQIELLITNEKFDEAEKLCEQLLKKDAHNPYAHLMLSEIYRAKGDLKRSNEKLKQAFANRELEIDVKLGILIGKVRQLPNKEIQEQCLELGDILVKSHPTDSKAYAMNADILVIAGKSKEALDQYIKSIRIDNSHFKIWQQIAILDYELNQIDSLRIHTDQALELFPNQSVLWFYNGLAHHLQKKYKKATVSLEEGKKFIGDDKNLMVQFNSVLGDSYHNLKDYKKSDECFEEALKADADNWVILNNYSYYLSLRKEKLEYARKMSEKVIREFPDNATYLDTYAWILYVMKDYKKAREMFEKIVDKTDNGTIIEHYGDVLYQLGEKDKALEQWKKAKQSGETSDFIDRKITDKKLYE